MFKFINERNHSLSLLKADTSISEKYILELQKKQYMGYELNY